MIEIVRPHFNIMLSAGFNVIDMWHIIFLQVAMQSLGNGNQTVFRATGNIEQL